MFKVKIEEATNEQLREYAQTMLQLDLEDSLSDADIRAKIDVVKPGLQLLTLNGDAPVQPTTSKAPVRAEYIPGADRVPPEDLSHFRFDPIVTINITETNDEARQSDVSIIVGPNQWWIKRAEDAPVPYRVYLALKQAEEWVMTPTGQKDPLTQLPIKEYRKRSPYPFSVDAASFPTPDEIREYHARTDHVKF
jgi:hypothetical protein